jgi:anti-sigma B factor antagonist
MSGHPFGLSISGETMSVFGEIDLAVAADLLDAILQWGTNDDRLSMTLDMGGVTFIDSTGISALIEAHKRLDGVGCRMRLANVPACVARVTELTGLDDYLGIAATDGATGEMAM